VIVQITSFADKYMHVQACAWSVVGRWWGKSRAVSLLISCFMSIASAARHAVSLSFQNMIWSVCLHSLSSDLSLGMWQSSNLDLNSVKLWTFQQVRNPSDFIAACQQFWPGCLEVGKAVKICLWTECRLLSDWSQNRWSVYKCSNR